MRTRLNSQNFALSGQSAKRSDLANLENQLWTDPYSAKFVEVIHDFLPITKTINHLAVKEASEGAMDRQGPLSRPP
jgi:hypothetical protein